MKTLGMLAHWTAILFLCGAPLAGLIGATPAAMIAGAVGMLTAEIHAGLFDEIIDHFAGLYAPEVDEYEAETNFVEREDA